ncbi:MAG: PLP-dependent aminotransferase family protein [Burkholderiaceae bacterium]|nr:PLP-dependent aminotransferase family protein [Burkholderiaceae bacterium]
MQLPLIVDAGRREPLHAQIFEQIRSRILDGTLRPHARLPASRALAADLSVSRNTITLAYERLMAEGYLEMRGPLGTFVSADPAADRLDVADPPALPPSPAQSSYDPSLVFDGCAHTVVPPHGEPLPYDFWIGRLDARLFSTRHWQRLLARTIFELPIGNSLYAPPAGIPALREAVAQHVGVARGIAARVGDVLIVNGIQEALNIVARLFLRRGRRVAIENPAYLGAANVFASYGARLVPVDVDAHGIDPRRLPAQASLLYVTPSHQYPTGATLPLERRERLRQWAEHNDVWIVEDDYDSDFHHGGAPLPALKARDDAQRVLYCGTFSKSLGGGLRIGYMVLPPRLMQAATTVKALLNNASAWHPQALLAEFLASGEFLHHLRRMRAVHASRRDALLAALQRHFGAVETSGAQSGMHLVWQLPAALPEARILCERARARGVGLYDFDTANVYLADARTHERHARAIALGYAALDERELEVAVRRIEEAVREAHDHRVTA